MSSLKSLNKLKALRLISPCSSVAKFHSVSSDNKYQNKRSKSKYSASLQNLFVGSTAAVLLGYHIYVNRKNYTHAKENNAEEKINNVKAGEYRDDLPVYSLSEISEHSTTEKKIWVTYKEGVYDITEFVRGHPGGDQILMAAGSSVEPFWLLYAVHNNPHVFEILENLRIGNISKDDAKSLTDDMSDPYSNDPRRHGALKPANLKPFNAEPHPSLLVQHFITPNELFYVRNHLPVPEVDSKAYELEVEVEESKKIMVLKLDDIKKLPKHTITATVMCAGNRRSEMVKVKPVKGLNWGPAAVGNATWSGAKLKDVLKMAGIDETTSFKHVQFEGLDVDATGKNYGASIPIWKAVDNRGDVILAYEMNDEPIPRDHGFPIRVIVPGVVGARNVKWLGKIVVSKNESDSHWQQNDYKGFSPSADWDSADFTKSPAIQELPVISAICIPSANETVTVEDGHILVKGYAWSGGGQKIIRVDLTIDSGKTWHVAHIDHQDSSPSPQHWSWTLWSIRLPVDKGQKQVEVWAKAVDSCYNTQPESFDNIWNLRGVLGNAYHRVPVNLKRK